MILAFILNLRSAGVPGPPSHAGVGVPTHPGAK